MAISNLVAFFIILTTAVTLHANGQPTSRPPSRRPRRCGRSPAMFAFILFSLGIIGTGLLAVPVLAGSVAYAVGEALRLARSAWSGRSTRPRPSTS